MRHERLGGLIAGLLLAAALPLAAPTSASAAGTVGENGQVINLSDDAEALHAELRTASGDDCPPLGGLSEMCDHYVVTQGELQGNEQDCVSDLAKGLFCRYQSNRIETVDLDGGDDSFQISDNATVDGLIDIHGGDGKDFIQRASSSFYGPAGYDYGDAGNDTLVDGAEPGVLSGGTGNDRLAGGAGDDELNGNDGRDTADYSSGYFAETVDLAGGTSSGGNCTSEFEYHDCDTLTGIENVIGSDNDDSLKGDGGRNVLTGGLGADGFAARGGNDVIKARDDVNDGSINCGPGSRDKAVLDSTPNDSNVHGCERVSRG